MPQDPFERIKIWKWALDTLAARIDEMGDAGMVYLPLYERTEQELAADQAKAKTLSTMRHRLHRVRATQRNAAQQQS
ncbi:hypothetical protein [Maritalea myrionectae]|uniref:hypothetical protein n=1 Tax=Maritalea myrionectae TaxID=454601 RepID=UPI00041FA5AD|nr:hypothetical protein [Maritalea myrionectae]